MPSSSPRTAVRFFKLSGGGNDFIAVLDTAFLTRDHAEALCAHGHSLGADGVFSIELGPESDPPAVRMIYRNADGSRAGLCVNGTRCAARLAFHLGWAVDRLAIATGAGKVVASRTGPDAVALDLPAPERPPEEVSVAADGRKVRGWFLDTGVPHFVIEWPHSLVTAPVGEWGPQIRESSRFEAGANVDFVRFVGRNQIEIRTFERGVEGETLACGTGVLAAAAVAVHLDRADLPLAALTSGGCILTVDGAVTRDRSIAGWTLAGDARLVAEGVLESGALSIPEPPLWSD